MKNIVLFFLFVITLNSISAQENNDHIVILSPSPLLFKVDFMCTNVIDARLDKTKIGVVKKGIPQKKVNANLLTLRTQNILK